MYREIAHLSKTITEKLKKEKWEKGLFLALNSFFWFGIGAVAALLYLLAGNFFSMSGIYTVACTILLLIAVFPGFYGGILYLFRHPATGTATENKSVRSSGCILYNFHDWKVQKTQTFFT